MAFDGGDHELTVFGGASDGPGDGEHPSLGFVIFTNIDSYTPPDPGDL
jgi:hypothetical protein